MTDSRYNLDNFISDKDKSFISANLQSLKDSATNVFTVSPGLTYRLDLIADLLYGNVSLKWVLIYVNDIIDISVVEHGYVMHYPDLKVVLAALNTTSEFL